MDNGFGETDRQFLLDSVFEAEKMYLKFINADLLVRHAVVDRPDLGIYILVNDENVIEHASKADAIEPEDKIAKLRKILKYAFPRYRFKFRSIGVYLYAVDRDLYELILKNRPNYSYGILHKLEVTEKSGASACGGGGDDDDDDNEGNDRKINWFEKREVLKFLSDNASCLNDLYTVSDVSGHYKQAFRYNLICNNIREYHEKSDDDEGEEEEEESRGSEDKLCGLFAVEEERLCIDHSRSIHALDLPMENECHYWAYWTNEGYPLRNFDDYVRKKDFENPLNYVASCTIAVGGGKPCDGGVYLSPIHTIVVYTTTPQNVRFVWTYTTLSFEKVNGTLRKWKHFLTSEDTAETGQRLHFFNEFFENESVLLNRFVLEMTRSCFIPFSVTFHLMYGYDIDDEVYSSIMGRLMDLKLFDVAENLSVDIFEKGLVFNDQYITCELKELASLVLNAKDGVKMSRYSLPDTLDMDVDEESCRLLSRTLAVAFVGERSWSELKDSAFFMSKLLDTSINDLFGRSLGHVPLTTKISYKLPFIVHNDGLKIGRFVTTTSTIADNFLKMGLTCTNERDDDDDDAVLCKYLLSESPFNARDDAVESSITSKFRQRGIWKDDENKKCVVHVKIVDARAQVCAAYNVSWENTAIVYVSQLLSNLGIVLVNTYDDGPSTSQNKNVGTRTKLLSVVDATTGYARCRRSDDCHELFDAMFFFDSERDDYVVVEKNVRLYHYDGEENTAGKPITRLKQLLSIKNAKNTKIIVILATFEGSLAYSVKRMLNRITGNCKKSDAVVRAILDKSMDDLGDGKDGRSIRSPICAAVVRVLTRRVIRDVFESVSVLTKRCCKIIFSKEDGDEILLEIPKECKNNVESNLEEVLGRFSKSSVFERKIVPSIIARYDGLLVITPTIFATFQNRHKSKRNGVSKYRIKIHGDIDDRPPAVSSAVKYACHWTMFNDEGGGDDDDDDDEEPKDVFDKLVDLFTAFYVFMFSQRDQKQFAVSVKSRDRRKDDPVEETDVCEKAVNEYVQKLETAKGCLDGLIRPVVISSSTMNSNDNVNVNDFHFFYESRDVAGSRPLQTNVVSINYYFFLKRYGKLIRNILNKNRRVYDRFVRREQRSGTAGVKTKSDVRSFREIVDSISAGAYRECLYRFKKSGSDCDKWKDIKKRHRLLFTI